MIIIKCIISRKSLGPILSKIKKVDFSPFFYLSEISGKPKFFGKIHLDRFSRIIIPHFDEENRLNSYEDLDADGLTNGRTFSVYSSTPQEGGE